MREVEDGHWWYRGLRGIFSDSQRRWGAAEGARVIDVGCGTGAVLSSLSLPQGFGLDLSVEAVSLCRARGLSTCVAASALALPFPDESFDMGVSFDVLPHKSIPEKELPLREIRRVLRPEGVLFLNVPAYQWLWSSHDAAVHQDRRFTKREILGRLDACGFQPLWATYWNTLLFPPMAAARVWRRIRPPSGSDFTAASGRRFSRVLSALLGLERTLLRRFPLPFGLSVFAVARKRG